VGYPGGDSRITTRTLELEGSDTVTAATGYSWDGQGDMASLELRTAGSTFGPHGSNTPGSRRSLRPSPSVPGIHLSHLSGRETRDQYEVTFHWSGPAQ